MKVDINYLPQKSNLMGEFHFFCQSHFCAYVKSMCANHEKLKFSPFPEENFVCEAPSVHQTMLLNLQTYVSNLSFHCFASKCNPFQLAINEFNVQSTHSSTTTANNSLQLPPAPSKTTSTSRVCVVGAAL